MKFQLLITILITSISSGVVRMAGGSIGKVAAGAIAGGAAAGAVGGSAGKVVGGKIPNTKTTTPHKSDGKLGAQSNKNQIAHFGGNSELGDLFQQIEELNNIVETEGDNVDALNNFKTTAKGVFQGVKKFYHSPAGQKTRDVVKVLLENNQNSLVSDQDLSSSDSLDSSLSEISQLDESDSFEAQKQEALQDLFMQIDDLNRTLEKEDGEGDNFGVLWGLKKAKQVYDVAKNVKDMIFPKK
ncbi:hypothetical protein CONCODRAFT_9946 [Conidiobolus coronatus NRRL 28638]|uniref:Secreted protein n=1 Tax=Conidiobolus coronatus (strain ATCC 28846 / CBS 209.66 / NRRL 28638) TaxID=796925 RepID=A0A137NYU6_CONC2|nr:hypothetical protein CONCODRAFT_9946 [Conidiobolus coronatus NRRL 28638]|eukprot:KXN67912.1 hypothetical protein CONCODRAFT_9946 [Conidiobolus coronatus NRRL 28638]